MFETVLSETVFGPFPTKAALHSNIEKAALQESGAFLPLSCGFQAPTFRHPRLGSADAIASEFCHKLPFARHVCSEDEIFAIAFAKLFAFAGEFLRNA